MIKKSNLALPPRFVFLLLVYITLLLPCFSLGWGGIAEEDGWRVDRYDRALRNILEVSINGEKISRSDQKKRVCSRLYLRLRVQDAKIIRSLTYNNCQLPLNKGVIEINVFVPYGRWNTIKLRVNGKHRLEVTTVYGLSGQGKRHRELYLEGLEKPEKAIDNALEILKKEPYNIRAYQLLISAQKTTPHSYQKVAESLVETYGSDKFLKDYGKGINVSALYAIAKTVAEVAKTSETSSNSNMAKAIQMYQNLLRISPFFAPAHLGLARIYHKESELQQAIHHLTLAHQLNFHNAFNLRRAVRGLMDELTQELKKEEKHDKESLLQRANLEFALNRSKQVIVQRYKKAENKATESDSDSFFIHRIRFNQILLDFRTGNWGEEQQQELNALLDEVDKSEESRLLRSIYLLLLSVTGDSRIKIDKKEQYYQHARWWLAHHSKNQLQLSENDNYLLMLKSLVEVNPGDPRYLNNLAVQLAKRGKSSDAMSILNKALRVSSQWKMGDSHTRAVAYETVYRNLIQEYNGHASKIANELRKMR